MRVLSMPDKWEYPWFAAWDLAFHTVAIALIDAEFAKEQLWFMLFEQFQHPNGQIPAYEWEFSDLNPPVHAWAVWRVYNMDRIRSGKADRDFLETLLPQAADQLRLVDQQGRPRRQQHLRGRLPRASTTSRCSTAREKLPDGAVLEQSDATGWMGMFCLNMMRIALELAQENPRLRRAGDQVLPALRLRRRGDEAAWAGATTTCGTRRTASSTTCCAIPTARFEKFRVRSLVGLIPLYAVERLEADVDRAVQGVHEQPATGSCDNRRDLVERVRQPRPATTASTTLALTIVDLHQLRAHARSGSCDRDEFLSRFGLRSLSKSHAEHPFVLGHGQVSYEPAEADVARSRAATRTGAARSGSRPRS